ncbi:hypothetical protein SRL2020226_34990 [Mycobacterium kiyosense]|uniref:Uncharacterized protein n=2 Tax=Mycobacterium kiyosense TaxID=2871094 RepID=A0A9P3Q374_9MYCO|nr:hypothetical protein SRL2020028_32900 [Mycobacterium kiyosense]GLB96723.1 hypothetical protein SRL2020226_34990 [Mycobacterium kiyosense]GLD30096.1 hypothetical protein Mkiyose1413_19790 [Mycobacterium kiyosense]GLD38873.1 hypothetical protein Mkiyose1595_50930 [Mycobacterium kiyosense]
MPEQYQLPGIVSGLRWIADGDYPAARLASHGPLGEIANVVHYLVGDPVQQTFDDFVELGRVLRENGRMPSIRPLLQISGLRLLQWQAAPRALVSAEVVPFRPHRGVLLLIEEPAGARPDAWLEWLAAEHYPELLGTRGVAGVWTFGATYAPVPRGWRTDPQYITVVYLDEDPLAVTAALAPLVEQRWRSETVRPVFAGPLRSMISWEAWV